MTKKRNWFVDFIVLIVLHLGSLALFIAGGIVLFSLRAPLPTFDWNASGAHGAGFVAGFFAWFSILYILYARKNKADIALAKERKINNDEPAFVCGVVKPLGPVLCAPFSGRDCIGYYYRVTHTTSSGTGPSRTTQWTDYEGYALTPFVIRSPKGDIHPIPEEFKEFYYELPKDEFNGSDTKVQKYLKETDFGDPIKSPLGETSRKKKVISGPGDFRFDTAIGDPPDDLTKCRYEERIIVPGEKFYAIGIYAAKEKALLPDPDILRKPFHLVKGDFSVLAKKTRIRYIGALICGGIALMDAAIYFWVYVPRQM